MLLAGVAAVQIGLLKTAVENRPIGKKEANKGGLLKERALLLVILDEFLIGTRPLCLGAFAYQISKSTFTSRTVAFQTLVSANIQAWKSSESPVTRFTAVETSHHYLRSVRDVIGRLEGENKIRVGYQSVLDEMIAGTKELPLRWFFRIELFLGAGSVLPYLKEIVLAGHQDDDWLAVEKADAVHVVVERVPFTPRDISMFPCQTEGDEPSLDLLIRRLHELQPDSDAADRERFELVQALYECLEGKNLNEDVAARTGRLLGKELVRNIFRLTVQTVFIMIGPRLRKTVSEARSGAARKVKAASTRRPRTQKKVTAKVEEEDSAIQGVIAIHDRIVGALAVDPVLNIDLATEFFTALSKSRAGNTSHESDIQFARMLIANFRNMS